MENTTYGIEKISVYPTALQLDLEELANARDMMWRTCTKSWWLKSVGSILRGKTHYHGRERCQTYAYRGRQSLNWFADSGFRNRLDHEKALSSWVFHHLDLPSNCRHFEVKIACYSGTAALRWVFRGWLRVWRKGQKALIITTMKVWIPSPPVGVCVWWWCSSHVVSDKPDFLALEMNKFGIYAHEVADVIRPLPWLETGNSEHSLFSYMEALAATFEDYRPMWRLWFTTSSNTIFITCHLAYQFSRAQTIAAHDTKWITMKLQLT